MLKGGVRTMPTQTRAGGTPVPPVVVRLVSIDYYMAPPTAGVDVCFSYFDGTPIEQVPVIRVFGSTPAGQKACVHLHKVRLFQQEPSWRL